MVHLHLSHSMFPAYVRNTNTLHCLTLESISGVIDTNSLSIPQIFYSSKSPKSRASLAFEFKFDIYVNLIALSICSYASILIDADRLLGFFFCFFFFEIQQ